MTVAQILATFAHDDKLKAALVVVFLDLVLGILAAFKLGTFRLAYVGDFLRNDILFKLVPWFILYTLALISGHVTIVIPGIDLGVVAGGAYVLIVGQWVGSILNSIQDLQLAGRPQTAALALAGAENDAPPKD